MDHEILITGATGMVGRELSALFLHKTSAKLYLLLHRRGADFDRAGVIKKYFGLQPLPEYVERLTLLQGEVTAERLGLGEAEYSGLRDVSGIIHAAATTRFDLPLEEARVINLAGAERMIEFALKCRKLEKFAFLSTAFVAGKRTGLIREEELEHKAGFVNSYEQSKYEAELLVDMARDRLPVAVYRLSTILGDSKTGRVTQINAPHQSIHIMYLGLAAMVAGKPSCVVDFMPGDYTAQTLFKLYTEHFAPGKTFHLTAGAANSYTLSEVIEETYRLLAEQDPEWARRRYPRPALASADAFELFLLSAAQANNPLMQNVVKVLGSYAEQFHYPKSFDTTNVLARLPDYEANLPDVSEYYGKVIAFLLAKRWRIHD